MKFSALPQLPKALTAILAAASGLAAASPALAAGSPARHVPPASSHQRLLARSHPAAQLAASAPTAGTALAWGDGGYGELGNGTSNISSTPVDVALPAGTTLSDLSAGYSHDLGVTSAGTVLAWGNNGSGQLGNGTTTSSGVPVQALLPAGVTATQVAAGFGFSLALTSTGSVYAWGDNTTGQLGNGTTGGTSGTPAAVSIPTGTTVTEIAAGSGAGYALTSSGTLYAWGDDTFGQLGNGTTGGNDPTPVAVFIPGGTTVSSISAEAGGSSALAATSAGQALAWGFGGGGNLGDGSTADSNVPVPVELPSGTQLTQVSAGGSFDLALTSTGSVLAWGGGSDGQLGDGTTTGSDVPVLVTLPSGTKASSVSAGGIFGLAVTTGGAALSWGDNAYGELGNGTTNGSDVPARVSLPSGEALAALSAGEDNAAAIVESPAAVTGLNPSAGPTYGGTRVTITGTGFAGASAVKFGTKAASGFSVTSPTTISAISPAGTGTVDVTVTGPGGASGAVAPDRFTYLKTGSALVWGFNDLGSLGNGTTTSPGTPLAPALPAGTTVKAAATEGDTNLILTSTGKVYASGENGSRELGNGTTTSSDVPVAVSFPTGTTIGAIAGGNATSLALTSAGKVYAWGDNGYGDLGNGTTTNSDVPVAVSIPAGNTVTGIAALGFGGLALTSTGKVYAWGYGGDGELGNGKTTSSDVPVAVSIPAGTKVTALAGNFYGGLVLTSTGSVMTWGYGGNGELGNGTTANSDRPVKVSLPANTAVKSIAGESYAGLALTSAGSVLAWGYNADGELGNGSTASSDVPVRVSTPAGTTFTTLGSEYDTGLALSTAGAVYAWGYGGNYDLGDGSTTSTSTPLRVALPAGTVATMVSKGLGDDGVVAVSVGPNVTSINPSSGAAAGGTTVTVTGTGFTGATTVDFGTKAAKFSVTSPTSVRATSPAGTGAVDVTVTGPGGTSEKVAADRFTYRTSGT